MLGTLLDIKTKINRRRETENKKFPSNINHTNNKIHKSSIINKKVSYV